MRNMSYMLTYPQMRDSTPENILKDLTRRNTRKDLRPGTDLMACRQCQGLPRGGKVERIRPIKILSNIPEPLMDIVRRPYRGGRWEVEREGFPHWIGHEEKYVEMYMDHNGGDPEQPVQRIEFRHIFDMSARRLIA